ncbi:MFS transporter [Streptomyces coeruleorubidus]|uniref:MFS transporter n=1 Tax=Streptomyces coeruleorubidus TaxID=116188 RepID=UPI00237FC775|nr:MFS transporter [Streptomyces coeruleorubidus]WDV50199.1 MFS transporter [Streptomyces coeruleorubidus]
MTELRKPPTSGGREPAAQVPSRAWAAWAAGALAYVIAIFNRGSLGVAGPKAADRLGIDATALSTFSAVQLGVFAATQIPVGLFVDRYGPRKMLTTSLSVMAAGQTMVAGGENFPTVLVGRALLGCGDAMVMISVLRLIAAWFPAARTPVLAQVTVVVGTAGGLAAAPPLSAALRAFSWEPVFFSIALVTACMIVVVWLVVRDTPPDSQLFGAHDARGSTLRTGLVEAWRQPTTQLGLWLMFTVHFPVQVFVLLWGYPFLTQGQGLSETTASYVTAVPLVVTMVLGPVFGVISGRRPHWRMPMVLGIASTTTLIWALVLLWPGAQAPLPVLFLLATILGLGNPAAVFGLDIARAGSPPHRVGAASGIANIGGYTAALLAMMLIGVTLDHTHAPFTDPSPADFRIALSTQILVQLLGAGLLLRRMHRTGTRSSEGPTDDQHDDKPAPTGRDHHR